MNPYGLIPLALVAFGLIIVMFQSIKKDDIRREPGLQAMGKIDRNVDTTERLPLKEVPYSPTGMFVNGDMLEELRKHDEAREASLPVLSLSCVTPQGDIVEEEP